MTMTVFEFLKTHIGLEFFLRYVWNLVCILILVYGIYAKKYKNKDFVFTLVLFNTIIFLICYLLSTSKLEQGFAFGLFALFSVLKYRTVLVPIREMGYLFASISIGLISAVSPLNHWNETLIFGGSNFLILILIYSLEYYWSSNQLSSKLIIYEKIDLILPEKRSLLVEDLKQRTGLEIHQLEIEDLDFLKDVAQIKIYYKDPEK